MPVEGLAHVGDYIEISLFGLVHAALRWRCWKVWRHAIRNCPKINWISCGHCLLDIAVGMFHNRRLIKKQGGGGCSPASICKTTNNQGDTG
jgi:hypothetical protein